LVVPIFLTLATDFPRLYSCMYMPVLHGAVILVHKHFHVNGKCIDHRRRPHREGRRRHHILNLAAELTAGVQRWS